MLRKIKETFDKSRTDYSIKNAAQLSYDLAFNPKPVKKLNQFEQELMNKAKLIQDRTVYDSKICIYDWNPSANKKALLVHGYGGRCLDFSDLIPILVENGYRVIGFDAPSHGFSEGKEADISDFWGCLEQIQNQFGKNFDLALGHSFGSAALTHMMRSENLNVKNLVLFAPNSIYDAVIHNYLRRLGAHDELYEPLVALVKQRLAIRAGIDGRELWDVCSTEKNMRVMTTVPHPRIKNVLVLHGAQDEMFPVYESQVVVEASKSVPCTFSVYDCGHREILSIENTQAAVTSLCKRIAYEYSGIHQLNMHAKSGMSINPNQTSATVKVTDECRAKL